jgi:hypothetical protein
LRHFEIIKFEWARRNLEEARIEREVSGLRAGGTTFQEVDAARPGPSAIRPQAPAGTEQKSDQQGRESEETADDRTTSLPPPHRAVLRQERTVRAAIKPNAEGALLLADQLFSI